MSSDRYLAREPSSVTDLSVCLFFEGLPDASRGIYHPTGYRLLLAGDGTARAHLAHLHEIHHKILNDDTNWGTAMHIAARHPQWANEVLPRLIQACRGVHESFASYMAISLARTRHAESTDAAMADYPSYERYAARFDQLLRPVPPGPRRDMAATGIARFCMGAPVLAAMIAAYPEPLTMSAVRTLDRPDPRFALCRSIPEAAVKAGVRAADAAMADVVGSAVTDLPGAVNDPALDSAWQIWEDTFTRRLTQAHPRLRDIPLFGSDDHLADAVALTCRMRENGLAVDLPIGSATDKPTDDAESVQRILRSATVTLRPAQWPGVTATIGEHVDAQAVANFAAETTQPGPRLVITGMNPGRLAADQQFSPADQRYLAGITDRPVFAVRGLIDHEGNDTIFHAIIPTPQAYRALLDRWSNRGPVVNYLLASCFVDQPWQAEWMVELLRHPTVVLVDTGLVGMVGQGRLLGADRPVFGTYIDLGHPYLRAIAWHVDGHPHVTLAMGDDLTVQLIAGQLQTLLGSRLHMSDSDWSAWQEVIAAVTTTVLRTHSALRYDGVEARQ